jgi:hypothetical protein
MNRVVEEAREALNNYRKCAFEDRWVYKEVIMVKHFPALIAEVERLSSLQSELSAEILRLSAIARY